MNSDRNRAEELFQEIHPEVIRTLKNAPEYGAVGIEMVFHAGKIVRTITKHEIARKLDGKD